MAVEPSGVMIAQRPSDAAPVVCARAEALPFRDNAFDVALAIFTVHHWRDVTRGLKELMRVSGRQVVMTWDPVFFAANYWFERDYLPGGPQEEGPGTLKAVCRALGPDVRVEPVLVPNDCTDGFYAAYWARPELYLDPGIRQGISAFVLEDQQRVQDALNRLSDDLASGAWSERYAWLTDLRELDVGYRLVIR
jgi:hypothetical protein